MVDFKKLTAEARARDRIRRDYPWTVSVPDPTDCEQCGKDSCDGTCGQRDAVDFLFGR